VRLLIVNGDDFGLARGVNQGIVEAHVGGILTSTSLMVLAPAATEAAALVRAHPELSVGLHVVEDDARSSIEPSFQAQLERFQELMGRDPTHVDSHHHVHKGRMAAFKELVEPLGVPLRGDGRVVYLGGFWPEPHHGAKDLDRIRRPFLRQLIATEVGEGFTELGCHPARVTDDLTSSYRDEREIELQTLTEPGLRNEIEDGGVRLASYHDWRP
jgi:predicted glycoside hydrolase/deacetylase ChbG (UPF0249 family)